MKLSRLNEGWQDDYDPEAWKGGYDPEGGEGDDSGDSSRIWDLLKDVIGDTNIDPEYYLIRTGDNEWITTPFNSEIWVMRKPRDNEIAKFNLSSFLNSEIKMSPISLVIDPDPDVWDVEWVDGWKINKNILLGMEIADPGLLGGG